jgi:hypothetical protein
VVRLEPTTNGLTISPEPSVPTDPFSPDLSSFQSNSCDLVMLLKTSCLGHAWATLGPRDAQKWCETTQGVERGQG